MLVLFKQNLYVFIEPLLYEHIALVLCENFMVSYIL